jgi:hypothetical protein
MKLSEVRNLADMNRYLSEFKNWNNEAHLYDFGAVVALWLGLLNNMRQLALEDELVDIGHRMTDEERQFLLKLAEYANMVTDKDIDAD